MDFSKSPHLISRTYYYKMISLPREAMFVVFDHCEDQTIRFACRRWYQWYDQWIVFDEERLSTNISCMCAYMIGDSVTKKSVQDRMCSLITLAGTKWNWNREMVQNPGMIYLLFSVSNQLRAKGLPGFVPDSSQHVIRFMSANGSLRETEVYDDLMVYPGIDMAAGVDRMVSMNSGTIEVLKCDGGRIGSLGAIDALGTCGEYTHINYDRIHSEIIVLEKPLVIDSITYHECVKWGTLGCSAALRGYLREPSSALSLVLMNASYADVLNAALHPSVPADMRQRYFDECWEDVAANYNCGYVLKIKEAALALGVLIREKV